jgi:hypothetical protein
VPLERLPELERAFHLLIELEETGIEFMVTDGTNVFLGPKQKLSLRLRGEVRKSRKLLAARLPVLLPGDAIIPETVECV